MLDLGLGRRSILPRSWQEEGQCGGGVGDETVNNVLEYQMFNVQGQEDRPNSRKEFSRAQ